MIFDWPVLLLISIIGYNVVLDWLPPHWRYFSRHQRRAMFLALKAFKVDHPESKAVWSHCWVYREDQEKCFVFIQISSWIQPPMISGYVVWHYREELDQLGCTQYHWGRTIDDTIQKYESRQMSNLLSD